MNIYPIDVIELFLKYGADPNGFDIHKITPIIYSSEYNPDTNVIKLLLDYNANINHRDIHGNTALMTTPYIQITEFLLNNGAYVDYKDINGNTELMNCITPNGEFINILILLLRYNPNPYIKNNDGYTALDIAIEYNNIEIIEILKDYMFGYAYSPN